MEKDKFVEMLKNPATRTDLAFEMHRLCPSANYQHIRREIDYLACGIISLLEEEKDEGAEQ